MKRDESDDDTGPSSHLENLQASPVVNKFIARVNDLLAHKLEATLPSFSGQMRVERALVSYLHQNDPVYRS